MNIDNRTHRICHLFILYFLVLMLAAITSAGEAADQNTNDTACVSPGEGYTLLGKIKPRHARNIESSNWSVGAETMDRDFTIYKNWRKYLGPLGVKKARIQAGWAKTEKQPGKYDWAWLDEIIPDMVDQGVEPWVCLCYGNPIYPGGGGTGLGGGIPTSEEALAAWDRFVAAFVQRYKNQVDEWEVWNEPSLQGINSSKTYADLLIRTAEIIRKQQPDARVIGFAMAGIKLTWMDEVLKQVQQKGKLNLIDEVSYHPYKYNPDQSYPAVEELRDLVKSYSKQLILRQGENGTPSQRGSFGALSKHNWTERGQAKWALRRLLGDLARGIPSSYFAICDMEYPSRRNYKGLLAINDDKTVNHKKTAYGAVQNLTAIFDDNLQRMPMLDPKVVARKGIKFFAAAYSSKDAKPLLTIWRGNDIPDVKPEVQRLSLTLENVKFNEPVWIDLLSGRVFAINDSIWETTSKGTTFKSLPVYDSPVVICDRGVISESLVEQK
ncbi:MAG: hypothetical protein JXM70_28050 [Pirellulales bacterium]|nr:hypothetical protein [Pirellulales bacterium]